MTISSDKGVSPEPFRSSHPDEKSPLSKKLPKGKLRTVPKEAFPIKPEQGAAASKKRNVTKGVSPKGAATSAKGKRAISSTVIRPLPRLAPSQVMSSAMKELAEETGFASEFKSFHQHSHYYVTHLHLHEVDAVPDGLIKRFLEREKLAAEKKNSALTEEERRDCARQLIQEEEIFQKKRTLMSAVEVLFPILHELAQREGLVDQMRGSSQGAPHGSYIHIGIDPIPEDLLKKFITKEAEAAAKIGRPLEETERKNCARKLIREERILEKKLSLQSATLSPLPSEASKQAKSIVMQELAKDRTLTSKLEEFRAQSARHGTHIHVDLVDIIPQSLVDDCVERERLATEQKKSVLTEEERKESARQLIQERKIVEKKLQFLSEIDSLQLSEAEKDFAKDAVLRNEYTDFAAFKARYFRGSPPQEMRTRVYAGKVAPPEDFTIPTLGQVVKVLPSQKYNRANYDPRKFFKSVSITVPAGKPLPKEVAKEWLVHRSIMRHFFSSLPENRKEMKLTLMQRSISFLSKFANMYDPAKISFQASPVGLQEHSYFRSNVSALTTQVTRIVAQTINEEGENIVLVTDSRVIEVVKRTFSTVQGSNIVNWQGSDFSTIFELLEKSDGLIFFDITKFMAATCYGHTDDIQEMREAIGIANAFLKDSLEKGLEEFVTINNPGMSPELLREKIEFLKNKLQDQLILGSTINIGEHTALYTTKLGFRTLNERGREVFHETGVGSLSEVFKNIVSYNGFTVGPNQLIDNCLRSAPTAETVSRGIDTMSSTLDTSVIFPESLSGMATFQSYDEFLQTNIFKSFEKLTSGPPEAPPYINILTKTTVALLQGLKNEEVFQRCEQAQLMSLLQLCLNKIQACMQDAIDARSSLLAFSNQIQLIHAEISTILAIAEPLKVEEFSSTMKHVTDMLPTDFPIDLQPEFFLKNSGIRCLASVLTACEQVKSSTTGSSESLQIAVQKDCYYESIIDLESARTHSTRSFRGKITPPVDLRSTQLRSTHTIAGKDLSASVSSLSSRLSSSQLASKKIDLYVCEFHHNISNVLDEYTEEDVIGQVDALFQNHMVSKSFTVAIDVTMNCTDDPKIKNFLQHNKERIAKGELNVVFYRSAQKFDMMGTDGYNGGIMAVVNNKKGFRQFNASITTDVSGAQDRLSRYNQQGLGFYQKYAQRELNEYRRAIVSATSKIGSPHSASHPLGLPAEMFGTQEYKGQAMIQLAPNADPGAVFLDLRNPWMEKGSKQAEEFYANLQGSFLVLTQKNPRDFSIDARPSFGFNHTNVTLIGGEKFRFCPGLESDDALKRYRDLFVTMNKIFQVAATDYRDPDVFNAINVRLSVPASLERLVTLAQKEEQGVMTAEDHVERAEIYVKAKNYKAAQRELELANTKGVMSQAAQSKAKLVQKSIPQKETTPKEELEKRSHESILELHDKLYAGAPRLTLLKYLGKAMDAAERSGQDQPFENISAKVSENFSSLGFAELHVIAQSVEDAAHGLKDGDPRKKILQQLYVLAKNEMEIRAPDQKDKSKKAFLKAEARVIPGGPGLMETSQKKPADSKDTGEKVASLIRIFDDKARATVSPRAKQASAGISKGKGKSVAEKVDFFKAKEKDDLPKKEPRPHLEPGAAPSK